MSSPPVGERPSMAPSLTDQIFGLPSQPSRVVPSNSLPIPAGPGGIAGAGPPPSGAGTPGVGVTGAGAGDGAGGGATAGGVVGSEVAGGGVVVPPPGGGVGVVGVALSPQPTRSRQATRQRRR